MVVTSSPSAWTASTLQDFTLRPSRCTVQAPQLLVSQPTTVPVLPSRSRRYWTSSVRGSTSSEYFAPSTVTLIRVIDNLLAGIGWATVKCAIVAALTSETRVTAVRQNRASLSDRAGTQARVSGGSGPRAPASRSPVPPHRSAMISAAMLTRRSPPGCARRGRARSARTAGPARRRSARPPQPRQPVLVGAPRAHRADVGDAVGQPQRHLEQRHVELRVVGEHAEHGALVDPAGLDLLARGTCAATSTTTSSADGEARARGEHRPGVADRHLVAEEVARPGRPRRRSRWRRRPASAAAARTTTTNTRRPSPRRSPSGP